jgi:transcriptional regulator with XRE-family HTH domain
MSDASGHGEDWATYLRRMTKRPGWSVAKLARESNVHRATIFGWLKGESGVTVASVRAIANALGDDVENALRAAGAAGAPPSGDRDEELELIMAAPVDDELKQMMVQRLRERRERERVARVADLKWELGIASQRGE